MKAIVQTSYGEPSQVLHEREVPRPDAGPGEVLIKVYATSVHADVWHAVTGLPYVLRLMGSGVRAPTVQIPGTDLAGVIEAVGEGVTQFSPGDKVFGEVTPTNQWRNGGCMAEFAAVPAERLAAMPRGITFNEAASIPTAALIALTNLRDQGRVQAGQSVLINGAGGGVGVYAVQLAKAYGARVTAVDSVEKSALLLSLGADRVLDYAVDDFTTMGERYDLILDVVSVRPFSEIRRALHPDGTFVLIGHDQYGRSGHSILGSMGRMLPLMAASPFRRQLPGVRPGPSREENLATLVRLLEEGKLRPVVDRTYGLGDTVEAMKYLVTGAAQGRIIIAV